MTEKILQRLDRETLALVEEFRREPNARISRLAQRLGLGVKLAELGDGNAGHLEVDKDSPSGYSILVNKSDPVYRQRWTTAHEIGHYLLHLRSEDQFPTVSVFHRNLDAFENYYSTDEIIEEREANAFAEAILIPLSALERAVGRGVAEAERIAAIFNVSVDAARIALQRSHRRKLRRKSMRRA